MTNLFWKTEKKTLNLVSKPFASEDEFERVIFDTKEFFEDLTFLKRQASHGAGTGRPDIIAIDGNGNICIIEMKNKPVDEKILSQVLGYAIWAESNPDSLKNLWYELEEQPDFTPDWDNYTVRILVIAPEIDPATLKFIPSINYNVELIEIKRWSFRNDSFLLINSLQPSISKKSKPLRGIEIYDVDFYKKRYNNKSVDYFFRYVNDTERLLKRHGWKNIEKKFNKFYCGFKYGFHNVFTIHWIGSKTFAFQFKLTEKESKKLTRGKLKMDSYKWGRAVYKVVPGKSKVTDFLPLIKATIKEKTVAD